MRDLTKFCAIMSSSKLTIIERTPPVEIPGGGISSVRRHFLAIENHGGEPPSPSRSPSAFQTHLHGRESPVQSWLKSRKAELYSVDSVQREGHKRAVPDPGSPQRQRTKYQVDSISAQGSWPPPSNKQSTSPVTVRTVSPRILSLCNKFASSDSTERNLLEPPGPPLTRSVSTPDISDERSDDEEISSLLNRRSGSTRNLRLTLAPSDSVSSEAAKHALLSPGYSPSSGYCSGVSNSPVCLSPRSQSPTMSEMQDKGRSHSLSLPNEHMKTLRTHSQDSGVSSITPESPRTLRKTLSAGNRSDSDEFGLTVPKMHRQRTLRRSSNITDSLESEGSSLACSAISKESLLSPDEGFQEVEKLAAEYADHSSKQADPEKTDSIPFRLNNTVKQDSRDSESSLERHQSVSQRNSLDVYMRRDFWARSDTLSTIQSSFEYGPPAVIVSDHCDIIVEESTPNSYTIIPDSGVTNSYLTTEDVDLNRKIKSSENKHEELERKLSTASTLSTVSSCSIATLSRESSLCIDEPSEESQSDQNSNKETKTAKSVSFLLV